MLPKDWIERTIVLLQAPCLGEKEVGNPNSKALDTKSFHSIQGYE